MGNMAVIMGNTERGVEESTSTHANQGPNLVQFPILFRFVWDFFLDMQIGVHELPTNRF